MRDRQKNLLPSRMLKGTQWLQLAFGLAIVAVVADVLASWYFTCGGEAFTELHLYKGAADCSATNGFVLSRVLHPTFNWYWSLFDKPGEAVTATFTIVLAISTIGLWWATHVMATLARVSAVTAITANNQTTQLFLAEQRPWVGLRGIVVESGQFVGGAYHFKCRFILKNTGRAPAFATYVHPRGFDNSQGGYDTGAEIAALVQRVRARTDNWPGFVLFPGDEMPQELSVSLSPPTNDKVLGLVFLFGIVSYVSALDNSVHHTEFHALLKYQGVLQIPRWPKFTDISVSLLGLGTAS